VKAHFAAQRENGGNGSEAHIGWEPQPAIDVPISGHDQGNSSDVNIVRPLLHFDNSKEPSVSSVLQWPTE